VNSGLWAIKAGNNGPGSNPSSIYLNAGINNETAGVFARIDAVPEPSGAVLLSIGIVLLAARRTLATRRG